MKKVLYSIFYVLVHIAYYGAIVAPSAYGLEVLCEKVQKKLKLN